jgi:hypothetical protein
MKIHTATLAAALATAALVSPASAAATVLIDYDDGIAGNGMHDASIRNGGFEDAAPGLTIPDIPYWNSYFSPEGDTGNILSTTNVHTGSQRAAVSGFGGSGTRYHLTQTIPGAAWTIQAGDVFTFSAWVRSGANFDIGTDSVQLVLHVVDGDGTPVPTQVGNADRIVQPVADPAAISAAYTLFSITTSPVPEGSPWIGNFLQPRILVTGDRNEFAIVDDVFLSAVPEPATSLLAALGSIALLRRRR